MPARRAVLLGVIGLVGVAAIAAYVALRPSPPPKLTLKQARFDQLVGWNDDDMAAALPAIRKSCAAIAARGAGDALDPTLKQGDFGTAGDWRPLCAKAGELHADSAEVRRFFESNFTPLLAGNNSKADGLFTGYYEIALSGSRQQGGTFQTPIYRRPPDPKAYSHAEIANGALKGKGLELVWVDDPVAAYFLQVQGSGVVHLAEGGTLRLGYDGGNGRPYVAIGRLLVERGEVPLKEMTMARLHDWIAAHGEAGLALMRENPSYVFFKDIPGDGPYGSEKVVLTAGRSLAIDRHFLPMGLPLWLEAEQRFQPGIIRRLMVAQDTGGAIKGPVRGDVYAGSGDAAGQEAGAFNATGRYYLLVPNEVAARVIAATRD
jgi:membrane-bound lytic murein transglycosylase A